MTQLDAQPAKIEKISKKSAESHEDKIRQLLSDYSSSPLENMDQSISFSGEISDSSMTIKHGFVKP